MTRAVAALVLLALYAAASDIGRVYPPASAPGLILGTPAANTAGAGLPEVPGREKASLVNQHLGRHYGDLAR